VSAIAGFVWHDGHDAERAELDAMLRAISHRGPDGSGGLVDGPVALGHQMRWSTPESLGERLPFLTSEGDIALTAEARIDNRDELFAMLSVPHPERATLTDSALIVRAYRQWGEACVERLIGEFAFVLWDARARRLICAVDACGSLPICYACPAGRFAFASEAKALHTLPGIARRLNEARFADRGITGLFWIDKESTFFEGIRVVPPASTLTVRPEGMTMRRYWDPATVPPPDFRSDDDFVNAIRDRVTEAVRCRLRSAYPVASMLSGGLDSSTLVALAARELAGTGRRLLTVSSVLPDDHPGPERDERPFIEAVAQIPGIDWTPVAPHIDQYATLADEFFWNERPSGPRHEIYHGLYAAAAAGNARTLLDGKGGELGVTAHGHEYLLHLFAGGRWLRLAKEVHAGSGVDEVSAARFAYRHVVRPLFARRRQRDDFADLAIAQSPLTPEMISRHRLRERLEHEAAANSRRSIGTVGHQRVYAANRMMRPQGAYAESFGVRSTYPFKDRRVVELSLHLPESLTRYRGYRRGLVRRAFDGVLPSRVQWRRDKVAFSPDYYGRLRAQRQQMRDVIESVSANDPVCGYLDLGKMRSALDALSRRADWSRGVPGAMGDPAMLVLDQGLGLLHFLRWCGVDDRATNSPSLSLRF
jgi:asparagine synthase (glutamine-hydrolysing)